MSAPPPQSLVSTTYDNVGDSGVGGLQLVATNTIVDVQLAVVFQQSNCDCSCCRRAIVVVNTVLAVVVLLWAVNVAAGVAVLTAGLLP